MCGIFGYIGKSQDASRIVFEGLKTLEYRGYDSWGIALGKNELITCEKHIGKIGDAKPKSIDSNMGIGHTRWATHGGVTIENAHPHVSSDNSFALLHNGIIENFGELKDGLVESSYRFNSETDTEVALRLLEHYLKSLNFEEAFKKMFSRLTGLNAIVCLDINGKKIYAAKTGSPVVIGKSDSDIYIASDASGIIRHTRNLLFLGDHQMVILDLIDGVRLIDLEKDEEIDPEFQEVNWEVEEADMGRFDHFMIKEIFDQSKVVRSIAESYSDQIDDLAEVVKESRGTFLIGAGTAYHACLGASYLFSKIAKRHVNTQMASEFNYLEDFLTDKSLIIALSQSGETIDVVEPLTRAKAKGSRIVALVNNLGSTVYRMADDKILLNAGPEKAVASTKAYIAKQAIMLMLSYAMIGETEKASQILIDAAFEIERLLEDDSLNKIEAIANLLKSKEHIFTIGRGPSFATSLEAALKIKEVSYIHTEGFAGGELKHGTIALITKGIPCIVFAPNDETYDAIISNAIEIKARGARIIGISHKHNDVFDDFIEVKDVGDFGLITHMIPAQILSYFLAVKRGNDPDKPRNLAKSVVVK